MSRDYSRLVDVDEVPAWGHPEAEARDPLGVLRDLAAQLVANGAEKAPNEDIPAAYTYFGQFVDHDVTLTSRPRARGGTEAVNLRAPGLDLDCVYGPGPRAAPWMFEPHGGSHPGLRFAFGKAAYDAGVPGLRGPNFAEPDLPRREQRFARVVRRGSGDDVIYVARTVRPAVSGGRVEPTRRDVAVPDEDVVEMAGLSYVPVRGFDEIATREGLQRAWPTTVKRIGFDALIGDPRNDENVIVSQLHLAFLGFHNFALDEVAAAAPGRSAYETFEEARRLVRWHYQWLVLNDYLPRLLGREQHEHWTKELLDRRKGDGQPRHPTVPIEFSLAAFRAGHAMVRPSYTLNELVRPEIRLFVEPGGPKSDLRGGRALPDRWTIQWDKFVSIDGSTPQPSLRITPGLSAPLAKLRVPVGERTESLPFTTLFRGWQAGLPAGQAAARWLGLPVVVEGNDPLWYYVLREAEAAADGRHLGPLGACIVAETLLGLLRDDPSSFVNAEPRWRPLWGTNGEFTLVDLLRRARMPLSAGDVERVVFGALAVNEG